MTKTEMVDRAFEIGMFQHRTEILAFAEWLPPLHHVMEIGALHGGSALLWGWLSDGRVISVDLPDGTYGGADHGMDYAWCVKRNDRLREMNDRIFGVLGDSHSLQTRVVVEVVLGSDKLDLLFIDGDHTYEGVRADWEMYRPLVKPGGIVAFHDVADTPLHRHVGCRVDRLWDEIEGEKVEFCVHADWGGIGAVRV